MNRMMTEEYEATLHGPVVVELRASREVEAALLKAVRDLAEWKHGERCSPNMKHGLPLGSGFEVCPDCAEIAAVVRMAETPEGYAAYKGASTELDSMPWCDHCVSYHHVTCPHIKWPNGGRCSIEDCGVCRLQAQEAAHAREVEDVCLSCGARTFSGICSAKCGG